MTITGELIKYLEQFITEERKDRINEVIANRTKYVTLVLEDIFQSHNISAVLRSCECFGIQDIHLIENRNQFTYSKDIELGSSNWLNILRHNKSKNNTLSTIKNLRKSGYRIIGTSPNMDCTPLNDLDLNTGPVAIFFGTEYTGLSDQAMKNCDEFLKIPLYGFTESLNISVSAAIIMNTIYSKLLKSDITWHLKPEEINNIKLEWLKNSIKRSDLLVKEYYKNIKHC